MRFLEALVFLSPFYFDITHTLHKPRKNSVMTTSVFPLHFSLPLYSEPSMCPSCLVCLGLSVPHRNLSFLTYNVISNRKQTWGRTGLLCAQQRLLLLPTYRSAPISSGSLHVDRFCLALSYLVQGFKEYIPLRVLYRTFLH